MILSRDFARRAATAGGPKLRTARSPASAAARATWQRPARTWQPRGSGGRQSRV